MVVARLAPVQHHTSKVQRTLVHDSLTLDYSVKRVHPTHLDDERA